jgi:hypothetical protein
MGEDEDVGPNDSVSNVFLYKQKRIAKIYDHTVFYEEKLDSAGKLTLRD